MEHPQVVDDTPTPITSLELQAALQWQAATNLDETATDRNGEPIPEEYREIEARFALAQHAILQLRMGHTEQGVQELYAATHSLPSIITVPVCLVALKAYIRHAAGRDSEANEHNRLRSEAAKYSL